jgi:hypothetical protein
MSNDNETLLEAQRAVILNGIEELATRTDLLDRCLLFNLPTIPKSQRAQRATSGATSTRLDR